MLSKDEESSIIRDTFVEEEGKQGRREMYCLQLAGKKLENLPETVPILVSSLPMRNSTKDGERRGMVTDSDQPAPGRDA